MAEPPDAPKGAQDDEAVGGGEHGDGERVLAPLASAGRDLVHVMRACVRVVRALTTIPHS